MKHRENFGGVHQQDWHFPYHTDPHGNGHGLDRPQSLLPSYNLMKAYLRQEIDLQQLKMTPMFPNVEEPQYLPETIDNGGQLAELPKLIAISSVAKETDNKGTSQPYTALSMPTFPESKEQSGKESSQVESPILNHDQRSNVKEDRVTPSQPEKPELCGCKLRILAKHSKTTWFQQYLTNLPRIDNCSRCMADQPAQGDPTTHTEPLQPPSRHKTIFINNGPIHFYDQHEKNKQSEEILMTQRQAQNDFIPNVRVSADSQRSIEKYPRDAVGLLPGRKSLERGHTPKDIHHEWDEMMVKYTRESPEKKDTQTMMEQDDKYWERRKKNNASAKKSRQVRRMKELNLAKMVKVFNVENTNLLEENKRLIRINRILYAENQRLKKLVNASSRSIENRRKSN